MSGKDLGMRKVGAALLLVALWMAGCGPPTKEDIVGKARNVSTRAELEKALGKPTDIGKIGPVETWTYKAKNGEVVFLLVGDKVTLQATGTPEKQR